MVSDDRIIVINGKRFKNVTNQTVAGPTYTRNEVRQIANHGHVTQIEYRITKTDNKSIQLTQTTGG